MADLFNTPFDPYQILNKISTEELRRIVREDFESDNQNDAKNDELITHIMEVIAKRESNDLSIPQFDVAAGWEDFQKNYQPVPEDFSPQKDHIGQNPLIQTRKKSQPYAKTSRPRKAGHRILRVVGIVAAILCLCAVTANALGSNLFKVFAYWADDFFQFRVEGMPFPKLELEDEDVAKEGDQTLQNILREAGITQPVSPSWIPDGFNFAALNVHTDIADPVYVERYVKADTQQAIIVSVYVHQEPIPSIQEKDDSPIHIYTAGGIDHYVMENMGSLSATWYVDNLECVISGEITEDEMDAMIDSIYEE